MVVAGINLIKKHQRRTGNVNTQFGIIFGGKAYRDEKNRALAQRRSQAKNAHRKYTDELAFEVGKDSRDTVRRSTA